MKKVVLLGDSIRLGYQPYLTELLKGRAEVGGIEDNGRFSLYTAWNVLAFLKATGSEADVIHWNNGLWDASRPIAEAGRLVSNEEYARNLRAILGELCRRRPNAAVIFATSTPTRPENQLTYNADVMELNDVARAVMAEEGVEINDLYALVAAHPEWICGDFIHLTPDGYAAAAEQVAAAVGKYL